MKRITKKRVRKVAKVKPTFSDYSDSIESFNTAISSVSDVLVARSREIEILKLCLLTKEHVLFNGPTGIAKSLLVEALVERVDGVKLFKKQFMKGTQPDEVYGCMNSRVYREESRWEYNTTDMLPEAHIAFLDEIYRASDSLLPSMFSIFNEREFKNSNTVMRCPLMCAIGTTNFITENEELEAFHDRWLIKVDVASLVKKRDKMIMLESFLSREVREPSRVSLETLLELQELVGEVEVSDSAKELYTELVTAYLQVKKAEEYYISDRTFCKAFRLAQAQALLSFEENEEFERPIVLPEHLIVARYALMPSVSDEHESIFDTVYARIVGEYESSKKERNTFTKMLTMARDFESSFDADMDIEDAKDLYRKVKGMLKMISEMTATQRPSSTIGTSLLTDTTHTLNELHDELKNQLKVGV